MIGLEEESITVQEWEEGSQGEKISVAGHSCIGTRKSQQDCLDFILDKNKVIAAVCDGMGGMEGGERASNLAINVLKEQYRLQKPDKDYDKFYQDVARQMNEAVLGLMDSKGRRLRSGTTVVSVLLEGRRLFFLSIGDSRIYLLRKGRLSKLTRMHNYRMRLDEMLAKGEISREQYYLEGEKRGEALISYLGQESLSLVDTNNAPVLLEKGDQVLLCSDGLYKALSDEQIEAVILESGGSCLLGSQRLVGTAERLSPEKQDNTSVILIRV